MFRSGLAVGSGILLNNLAGDISDGVLAGLGVATKIMMFPFSIILGFGSGFQPVVGFNWGAKRYDRVKESYRFSAWVALIGAAMMAAILAIFADEIIMLFSSAEDQSTQMKQIGALAIRLQCLSLPIHAWVAVVNMFCTGLGNALGAVLLATARQGSCFIPILFPMAMLWGEYGIASVQAAADVLTLLLAIPILIVTNKKIKRAMQLENSVLSA